MYSVPLNWIGVWAARGISSTTTRRPSRSTAWKAKWSGGVRECRSQFSNASFPTLARIGLVVKNVVHALLCATSVDFPPHIDAAIGESDFFANLGVEIPACRHEGGRDELGADVAFAERFFVHSAKESSSLGIFQSAPVRARRMAGKGRGKHEEAMKSAAGVAVRNCPGSS